MYAGRAKLNGTGKIAIFTAVALLVVAVAAVGSIYGYKQYLRDQRYDACLADDALAKAWFSGELIPTAEGHNEPIDGEYIGGAYTTYYFGVGAGVSYVTEYDDVDMVLIYTSGSDHLRQYDGGELVNISIGKYDHGNHSFEMYPVVER